MIVGRVVFVNTVPKEIGQEKTIDALIVMKRLQTEPVKSQKRRERRNNAAAREPEDLILWFVSRRCFCALSHTNLTHCFSGMSDTNKLDPLLSYHLSAITSHLFRKDAVCISIETIFYLTRSTLYCPDSATTGKREKKASFRASVDRSSGDISTYPIPYSSSKPRASGPPRYILFTSSSRSR